MDEDSGATSIEESTRKAELDSGVRSPSSGEAIDKEVDSDLDGNASMFKVRRSREKISIGGNLRAREIRIDPQGTGIVLKQDTASQWLVFEICGHPHVDPSLWKSSPDKYVVSPFLTDEQTLGLTYMIMKLRFPVPPRPWHGRGKPVEDPDAYKLLAARIPKDLADRMRALPGSITEHLEASIRLYLEVLACKPNAFDE